MKNKYEDPTQRLVSHNWSEEYKNNYDKIFGKKETWLERKARLEKEQATVCDLEEKEKEHINDSLD